MSGTCRVRLALGLVLVGAAAGCRSLPGPPSLLDGGLVSSPPLPAEREQAARAHALYSLGIHHELADEYDLAGQAYLRASELDPGNERILLRLASILVLQRRTEDALRTVEEFIDRYPSSEKALGWLAAFYGSTGDQERVLQLYRRMTRQFPANPLGWLQLASATARQSPDTPADVIRILESGLAKARPPTALRQELVRLHLARMRDAADEPARRQARRNAIARLREVADELPGDMDTLFALGDLLVRDEQLEEAIQVYETIERLQPADLQVKQRLARTFLAMDDQAKAIAVLERLAARDTGSANIHFYLGELYLQSGDAANAEEQFRTAAQASPDDPAPWLRLAALQAELSSEQAIATLNEALGTMPGNPRLLEVLALIHLGQNQYAKAEKLLAQVWQTVSADDPDAIPSNLFFYNYATVCTHLRRVPDAADWLERALGQEPALLDLYMQRVLTGTPSFRQTATRVLNNLAKRNTSFGAALHGNLATLYLARENPSRAVKEFKRALAIIQSDPLQSDVLTPRFHFWHGVALDQAKQTDLAVEQFETAIRLDPDYAEALNYLAYLWAVRGERLDEALRHIQTALDLDPENPAFLDTLGWIYFQQGRYEDALDLLQQADRLRPGDPEILDHLRQTLDKLGR